MQKERKAKLEVYQSGKEWFMGGCCDGREVWDWGDGDRWSSDNPEGEQMKKLESNLQPILSLIMVELKCIEALHSITHFKWCFEYAYHDVVWHILLR